MIHIVDYGLGNVLALQNMYKRMNVDVALARSAADLADAKRVILPGVGAFNHAMQLLNRSGMREPLDALVRDGRTPVLGICVGMQMLGRSSSEGTERGLGYVDGDVRGFKALALPDLLLPHMGWNDVRPLRSGGLFAGLETDARFYFLHSYYFNCDRAGDAVAVSTYGVEFACAVQVGNVYGVQFHPEKSHHFGAQLLKHFAEI